MTLSVLGMTFAANDDLVRLAGLDDPEGRHYKRDLGLFAGFMAESEPGAVFSGLAAAKALMRVAGERARIIAEHNALTARQKIAEIELRTAEEKTRAAAMAAGHWVTG